MRYLLLLLIFLNIQVVFAQKVSDKQAERMAVLQIQNQTKLSASDVSFLSTLLQEEIQVLGRNKFVVMTQENILTLLPPGQKLEDCMGTCEVDTGRLLGASYLVSAKLSYFGTQKNNLRLTIRLHETKTGELLASHNIKGTTAEDMEPQIKDLATKILQDAKLIEVQGVLAVIGSNGTIDREMPTTIPPTTTDIRPIYAPPPPEKQESQIKINQIDFIYLKDGAFLMGSEAKEESPMRIVNIKGFYLSKSEITVGQYMKCVQAGACTTPHWKDNTCWFWDGYNWVHQEIALTFIGENKPVACISWHEARSFAKWIGGDLPTEAQWEYAAKSGGQSVKYPWGNSEPTCSKLNYNYNCVKASSDVCSFTQGNSSQGLCDMSGNVYEWVLDDWIENYENAPNHELARCKNQSCIVAPDEKKIYRGGSWVHLGDYAKTTFRYGDTSNAVSIAIGFRVAYPAR